MAAVATLAPVSIVLRVACPCCGARPRAWCEGGPPVCPERMEAAQDEFEAQYRAVLRSVRTADEWADDPPTVPMRGPFASEASP